MANFTPNFNLKKPLGAEFFNVEDQNGNMDIIDGKMKDLSSADGVGIPEVIATALGLPSTASVADGFNALKLSGKVETGTFFVASTNPKITFSFNPFVVFLTFKYRDFNDYDEIQMVIAVNDGYQSPSGETKSQYIVISDSGNRFLLRKTAFGDGYLEFENGDAGINSFCSYTAIGEII